MAALLLSLVILAPVLAVVFRNNPSSGRANAPRHPCHPDDPEMKRLRAMTGPQLYESMYEDALQTEEWNRACTHAAQEMRDAGDEDTARLIESRKRKAHYPSKMLRGY